MDRPWRIFWLALGWVLIVLSPVVGAIPGPGGMFVFAGGVALLLRNSQWAKRRYVALKRRWPKLGHTSDGFMRRASHRRRVERRSATRE